MAISQSIWKSAEGVLATLQQYVYKVKYNINVFLRKNNISKLEIINNDWHLRLQSLFENIFEWHVEEKDRRFESAF